MVYKLLYESIETQTHALSRDNCTKCEEQPQQMKRKRMALFTRFFYFYLGGGWLSPTVPKKSAPNLFFFGPAYLILSACIY